MEEESEEIEKEEELEKIEEEKPEEDAGKKKKKKKKKKGQQKPQEQTEVKEEVENNDDKKKKKKKKKGAMASKIQKKLDEKKKQEEEQRQKQYTILKEWKDFKKKQDYEANKQERMKQEQIKRAEEARKRIEEMNKRFNEQLNQDGEALQPSELTKKSKKKKKLNKKEKMLMSERNFISKDTEEVEKEEDEQKEEQIKEEVVFDEVDDWENLLEDENEDPEEKKKKEEEEERQRKQKEQEKLEKQKQKLLEQKKLEEQRLLEEQEREKEREFADPLKVFKSNSEFRCPIICIMGHVDTGKTKILDNIRNTKVQLGEEGGITQQIGASFFPQSKLKEEVEKLSKQILDVDVKIPGLLVIDTPGHESFANLRSRGSSLCDFAIVVIDVMHSIEKQTIESLNLLIERKTPFVVALNKIDRIQDWKVRKDISSYKSFMKQSEFTKNCFEEKMKPVVGDLMQFNINAELYWKNNNPKEYFSIVPTSAITGEGMSDLLGYIAYFTQKYQKTQITKNYEDFKATVLEVKKIEGMGATIDIIIVNGILKVDDKVILSGFDGCIVTTVKALMTPHPMKEMRVKNDYLYHKEVRGSMGVKLQCTGLERALAGSSIYKYETEEEREYYEQSLMEDIKKVKKKVKLKKEGVGVAASTLGSLEALLKFLKDSKIPVSTVCIGDVSKNDLLRVMTPFLQEENRCKKTEYMTMLCFDVKLLSDAKKFAQDNKIKVIEAKIIYHLFDGFTKHVKDIKEQRKKEEGHLAVFPCVLQSIQCFNQKNPIILGVDVVRGILRPGTTLCIPEKDNMIVGVVETIQSQNQTIPVARKKNGSVAIRLKTSLMFKRHFDIEDQLVSKLTRQSIDMLKEHYRDEMLKDDWNLVRTLKGTFNIDQLTQKK